jgi:hypothetical protein
LSHLNQLRAVSLWGTPVTDLSPLSSLSHLETLLCHNTKISDLTPLSKCSELKALNINGTEVKSLAPLFWCKKLKNLNHGKVKDKNEDETRGRVEMLAELMPGLACNMYNEDLNFQWYQSLPDELQHGYY